MSGPDRRGSAALGADLAEFMRTMKPPAGQSTVSFLRAADKLINADLPPVGGYHPGVTVANVGGWQLKADVLIPSGVGPHPALLFLHGGSWSDSAPWGGGLRIGVESRAVINESC